MKKAILLSLLLTLLAYASIDRVDDDDIPYWPENILSGDPNDLDEYIMVLVKTLQETQGEIVAAVNLGVDLDDTNVRYFGTMNAAGEYADDAWRIIKVGADDFEFQKKISGTWTEVAKWSESLYTAIGITATGTITGAAFTDGTYTNTMWNDAYDKRVDTWTAPLSWSSYVASISQATTSVDGYLSSTDWTTFNNKWDALSDIALDDAEIIVGNSSDVAAAVAMSGDVTISNAGVTALANDTVAVAEFLASQDWGDLSTDASGNVTLDVNVVSAGELASGDYGDWSVDGAGVATIDADSIALTTDTTGNYVLSITNGAGISGGDGGSEAAALTIAATLGTAIDTTEITDDTIEIVDFNMLNTPADEDVLVYDTATGGGFKGLTLTEIFDGSGEIEEDAANTQFILSTYHDTEATTPLLTLRKADNTAAAPALVDDNAVLGTIHFDGYDGSGWHTGSKIEARIDGTPSDGTDIPTELLFYTVSDGSATLVERMRLEAGGDVILVQDGLGKVGIQEGTPAEMLDIIDDSTKATAVKLSNSSGSPTTRWALAALGTGLNWGANKSFVFRDLLQDSSAIQIEQASGAASHHNALYIEADGDIVLGYDLAVTGGVTIATGQALIVGTTTWTSSDELDGTIIKDADYGDIDVSAGGAWTLDTNSVAENELLSGDYGDIVIDGAGAITLDTNSVAANELLSGDYGDVTIDGAGAVTIDNDVVEAADMKHEDHGEVTYASGTAVVEDSLAVSSWNLTTATLTTSASLSDGFRLGDSGEPNMIFDETNDDLELYGGDLTFIQNKTDATTGVQVLDADGGTAILNIDTTNERVAVGTNSPLVPLHVEGASGVTLQLRSNSGGDSAGIALYPKFAESSANSRAWAWKVNNQAYGNFDLVVSDNVDLDPATQVMSFDKAGKAGFKTTSPDTVVQVVGDCKFGDDNTNYASVGTTGNISFTGSAELIIPSSTTLPGTANVGSLYLDTDAGTNGTVYMYANGAWRAVIVLP